MPGEKDFDMQYFKNYLNYLSTSLFVINKIVFIYFTFSAEGIKLHLDSSDDKLQVERCGHFDLSVR